MHKYPIMVECPMCLKYQLSHRYCMQCGHGKPPLPPEEVERRQEATERWEKRLQGEPEEDPPMAQMEGGNGTTLKLGDVVKIRVSKKTGNVWKPKGRTDGSGLLQGMVVYLGPSLPDEEVEYVETQWVDPLVHSDVNTLVNLVEPSPRFRGSGETGDHHTVISVLLSNNSSRPPVYYHVPVTRLIFVKEGNINT